MLGLTGAARISAQRRDPNTLRDLGQHGVYRGLTDDQHGELCCLVQAESPEDVEEPLAELVQRLRDEKGALQGVEKLLLLDIIELPSTPGNAVLWSSSWRHFEGHGFGATRGARLIDDSGTGNAHEWVHEKNRADREADRPHTIEPFIRFEL